jgi:uncharacterized damage-inducible protein DinB
MPHEADQYRRWFEYEQDVHAKVLQALASVPSERRSGPEYRKAVQLLGHLVAARQVWLFRLGILAKPPDAFFPENRDLGEVVKDLQAVQAAWTDYLARLTDADLDRPFEYRSLDAGRFRNRLGDVLAQLFGHSWYHRGQIAMLVRAAGGEPAITDFIYWCREPLPADG